MEYIEKKQLNALYDEDAVTMKGWAMIKQMPTIDIVWCHECVYYGTVGCACAIMEKRSTEDEFCSFGERRAE